MYFRTYAYYIYNTYIYVITKKRGSEFMSVRAKREGLEGRKKMGNDAIIFYQVKIIIRIKTY